jgi:integrase
VLSDEQRSILRTLVEQAEDVRGEELFALGYWAGCRVSDVAHLLLEHTHVGPKIGWLHVGHKGGKFRDIDLLNQARRPLFDYLQHGGRDKTSPYVFTSQRNQRLTEAGIHHWFRTLKQRANKGQWDTISDLSFHDLRHDFAHRAREAGWTLEGVAYYLGHVTKKGTPAIQTTARYGLLGPPTKYTTLRSVEPIRRRSQRSYLLQKNCFLPLSFTSASSQDQLR